MLYIMLYKSYVSEEHDRWSVQGMQKLVKVFIICLKLTENTIMLYFWDRSLKKNYSQFLKIKLYSLLADISVHLDLSSLLYIKGLFKHLA